MFANCDNIQNATISDALQVAVCIGFVLPLFVSYFIEARSKLRFAQQAGILPAGGLHLLSNGLRCDLPTVLLMAVNILTLTNILTVEAVLRISTALKRV